MNFKQRLIRLSRLSPRNIPRVVVRRLASTGRAAQERFFYRPDGPRRSPPPRQIRPLSYFHPEVKGPGFGARLQSAYPADAQALIAAADAAAALTFDLLGSGPVDLNAFKTRSDLKMYPDAPDPRALRLAQRGKVPWHFDFKSGTAWPPDAFFSDIAWGARGVDIKVPWELSRCQHFVTLAQAYALTSDDKYSRAFSDQLEDWIRANPPKYGVNWACAMDVALRAGNWIAAWDVFHDAPGVSDVVKERLPGALWEHGRHIFDHLEWGGELSSNHYLSDIFGLAAVGKALGEDEWWEFALQEMSSQIIAQTYDDGLDFEGATGYHRLVLELFFYFAWFASAGAPAGARRDVLSSVAGERFTERLARMGAALAALGDAAGRVPLIGDNDSGRAHVFLARDDSDMTYLVDLLALFFQDRRFRPRRPAASETVWLFGFEAAASLADFGVAPAALPSLAAGPSGLATLRGGKDLLVFAAQPNGTRGVGNHTHNDKLSVCLTVGADAFLADPGTYVYTPVPEERDAFRSTAAHTTVEVDGAEQNRFVPGQLFTMHDDARVRFTEFKENRRAAAEHDGYRLLPDPVVHRRSVERIESPLSWIIEDELEGAGEHELRWRFVCGEGIRAEAGDNGTARLTGREGALEISAHLPGLRFFVQPHALAPKYGKKIESQVVFGAWRGRLPHRATFTLVWTPLGGREA